jgi:hypothetical protein
MADFIGAAAKLTANAAMRPPGLVVPLKPNIKQDGNLQAALGRALTVVQTGLTDARTQYPQMPEDLKSCAFAVADLTFDEDIQGYGPAAPAYAGFNDTHLFPIASLAKLLPLYVAHLLRAEARKLAAATGTTSIASLGPLLRAHLKRTDCAGGDGFPLVEDMFDIANDVVDFKAGGTQWNGSTFILDTDLQDLNAADQRAPAVEGLLSNSTPLATKTIVRAQLTQVAFREQLRLMARWSNDVSASIVIQAIGFRCLWKLSNQSGLFRDRSWEALTGPRKGQFVDPGGLFLGKDYAGNFWTERPVGAPVRDKQPSQAGNARSVSQLMASLANDLVDDEARISMREMLRKDSTFRGPADPGDDDVHMGEASRIGIGMGLSPNSWAPNQSSWQFGDPIPAETTPDGSTLRHGDLAVSKLGLLYPGLSPLSVSSHALLVRSARGPINITAVLVAIAVWHDVSPDYLSVIAIAFGEAMAAELALRHA